MAKSSFVLRALKILGLEEMLKLSEVLHVKQAPLKKAAGEELIVWDEEPVQKPVKRTVSAPTSGPQEREVTEARVLNFPKKSIADLAPQVEEERPEDAKTEDSTFLSSEVVLWQREIARSTETAVHKLDAFKGYHKATEMYVVKTPTVDGKDKIRFAETNGVLINKKQA
ncbi:hypothetical protein ACJVC5_04865 [Peredibacter sp. HCB2-198]|uniref:hypothetical protein n=1 Tax=Peredibacter sp. HCB2-198 TaxID=3383025 RepID=UPI0038B63FE3